MGMGFLHLLAFIAMFPSFNLLLVGFDEDTPKFRRVSAGAGLITMAGFLGLMTFLLV